MYPSDVTLYCPIMEAQRAAEVTGNLQFVVPIDPAAGGGFRAVAEAPAEGSYITVDHRGVCTLLSAEETRIGAERDRLKRTVDRLQEEVSDMEDRYSSSCDERRRLESDLDEERSRGRDLQYEVDSLRRDLDQERRRTEDAESRAAHAQRANSGYW